MPDDWPAFVVGAILGAGFACSVLAWALHWNAYIALAITFGFVGHLATAIVGIRGT